MAALFGALALFAAGAGLGFTHLFAALCGLIVLIPLDLPLELGKTTVYTNEAYLAGLAVGLAWHAARSANLRRIVWFCLWPLLPFLGLAALSIAGATNPAAGCKQWLRWAEFALALCATGAAVQKQADFKRFGTWLLAVVFAVSLLGILQSTWGAAWTMALNPVQPGADAMQGIHATRASATFGHPNQFAGFLELWLPWALACLLLAGTWRSQTASGAVTLAAALALALTFSRGAWVGTVAGAGLFLIAAVRLRPWPVVAVVLAALMAAAALWLVSPDLRARIRSFSAAKQDAAAAGRVDYQKLAWAMVRERPWLGHGAGNYPGVLERYQKRGLADHAYVNSHIHNLVAQVAIETGFLGAAAFLFFLGLALWRFLANLQRLTAPGDRLLLMALFSGAVAFLIHNQFDVLTVYARGIHFALLLGLGMAVSCWPGLNNGVST